MRVKDYDIKCILNVFLNVVKILSLWVWWVYEFLYMYMYYEFIGYIYKIELINIYEFWN